MSRIGKRPIDVPQGVKVEIQGNKITINGPKGTLDFMCVSEVAIKMAENVILVEKKGTSRKASAIWGTTNKLISNMVKGVVDGFEERLELNGVGFRMALQGKKLNMALGFSHPVEIAIPEGLEVKIEDNIMIVSGIDKQRVGQFAAEIRRLKPAEPYKGKGFRYAGEIVRRKEGKKAASAE